MTCISVDYELASPLDEKSCWSWTVWCASERSDFDVKDKVGLWKEDAPAQYGRAGKVLESCLSGKKPQSVACRIVVVDKAWGVIPGGTCRKCRFRSGVRTYRLELYLGRF